MPNDRTYEPTNPRHYRMGEVECIQAMESALGPRNMLEFFRGQIIKYAWRFHYKDDALTNARKLLWYAERLAATQEELAKSCEKVVLDPYAGPDTPA